jgi:hypothetical protein
MTSKSDKATLAGKPTETKAPAGLRFLEDEKPHHTAILAEGSVSGMLPIDSGTWDRYVQSARRIIDERSGDYNAMGMQILGLAICHVLTEGYTGTKNKPEPEAKPAPTKARQSIRFRKIIPPGAT